MVVVGEAAPLRYDDGMNLEGNRDRDYSALGGEDSALSRVLINVLVMRIFTLWRR